MKAVATIETTDAAAWAERIASCWQQSVGAILETGRLIAESKAALPHGEFTAMIETALPFGARTAQRLMAIGADERLSKPTHVSRLPPSWGTLYELTKLPDEQFEAKIADGSIRPDMERREVVNGARSIMGSREHPADDLDYAPTPPWATRALLDIVLPRCIMFREIASAWEPACGEGHISGVLEEHPIAVVATDIHDYSADGQMPPAWLRAQDFLDPEIETPEVDWIITNPPFGAEAIKFVKRALDLAHVGVAMFFRSQWAVEGVERYNELFRDQPPTICAFFVERVPLHMGRWEPEGSTATAYCWLVWKKGAKPQPTFWIPPGQRIALTRTDDATRFTAHPVAPFVPHDPITGEIHEDGEADVDISLPQTVTPKLDPGTGEGALSHPVSGFHEPDDDVEIPAFLRRGNPDCIVQEQVG